MMKGAGVMLSRWRFVVIGTAVLASCGPAASDGQSAGGDNILSSNHDVGGSSPDIASILSEPVMVIDGDGVPLNGLTLRDIYEQYAAGGSEISARRIAAGVQMVVKDVEDAFPWSSMALDFSPADQLGERKLILYEIRYDGAVFSKATTTHTPSGTLPMTLLRDEFAARLQRDEAFAARRDEQRRKQQAAAADTNKRMDCWRAAQGNGAMGGSTPEELGCPPGYTDGPKHAPAIEMPITPGVAGAPGVVDNAGMFGPQSDASRARAEEQASRANRNNQ